MKRTTIFLDESDERDLKALAARRDEPVASLVREAIAEYLVRSTGDEVHELTFVGAGRSGRSDIAETHEELLWSDLEPHGGAVSPAPAAAAKRGTRGLRRTRR